MKEKIEEKLEKNIERILKKEELTNDDVFFLRDKLNEIRQEENKEETDLKKKN